MSNVYAATPRNVMRADALAGVRTRRILAVCIDFVLVSLLVAAIWFASIVLTLRSGAVLPPSDALSDRRFLLQRPHRLGPQHGDARHAGAGP